MKKQEQTVKGFSDKWNKNKKLAFDFTLSEGSAFFDWIIKRNGFKTPEGMAEFLSNKKRILDAGCGNGRVTALLKKFAPESAHITGIDIAASEVAKENLKELDNMSFYQKDLLGDLSDLEKFDFIYCQEVLHHTENPKEAFLNLTKLLDDNGEIAIYVYKKKAPIREFTDEFVRELIKSMPYNDAMDVCRKITDIGKALNEIDAKINVPQIDLLDIQEGEYTIQRFIYHFFMKCFWNDEFSHEDNAVINYDWYYPSLCSKHTIDEVINWFKEAGINVVWKDVDFYGITVRGKKY